MRNLEKEQRLGRNGIENLCIKPTFNYCTGEEQFTFFKLPKCLIDDACFWGLSIDAKLLYAIFLDRVSLSIKNGWYKIEMEDGKIAWTNGQYITLAGEVTADKLNIRKGPATSYDIVGNKVKEDKVKVLKAFENGWYEIELEDGETGFICGKYVDTKVENEHDYSELNNKTTTTTTSTSAKPVSTSTTQSSSNVVKTMTVSATAYAGDSMTSTGAIPKVGRTIAVDPSVIPYGTRVYIPALGGVYVAEDCGGAIKGNKIDIFMASESACNSWGVRSIEIQILK